MWQRTLDTLNWTPSTEAPLTLEKSVMTDISLEKYNLFTSPLTYVNQRHGPPKKANIGSKQYSWREGGDKIDIADGANLSLGEGQRFGSVIC